MSRVIPLHLYCARKSLANRKYVNFLRSCCEKDISALWLEVQDRDDINLYTELSSYCQTQIVPVVKDPHLTGEVAGSSAGGIAIKPAWRSELLRYRDILIEKECAVYLYQDYRDCAAVSGMDGLGDLLNEISDSVIELKNSGIENIFVHLYHPDPVIHFNINKNLKERHGVGHVISPNPSLMKEKGVILNSISLGSLFYEKIGDLLLLRTPAGNENNQKNLKEALELSKKILGSFKLFPTSYTIISCPMCGRCQMDLLKMTGEIDRALKKLEKRYNHRGKKLEDIGGIVVAVMGCNVNGPGEARNADIGIASGKNHTGILFKNGRAFKILPENRLVDELIHHTKDIIDSRISSFKKADSMSKTLCNGQ